MLCDINQSIKQLILEYIQIKMNKNENKSNSRRKNIINDYKVRKKTIKLIKQIDWKKLKYNSEKKNKKIYMLCKSSKNIIIIKLIIIIFVNFDHFSYSSINVK